MESLKDMENWKKETLIIGAVVGIAVGLLSAYALIQKAEENENVPKLTSREGVSLGIGVLGLVRQVQQMGR
jgi:hypothetical protein